MQCCALEYSVCSTTIILGRVRMFLLIITCYSYSDLSLKFRCFFLFGGFFLFFKFQNELSTRGFLILPNHFQREKEHTHIYKFQLIYQTSLQCVSKPLICVTDNYGMYSNKHLSYNEINTEIIYCISYLSIISAPNTAQVWSTEYGGIQTLAAKYF